MAKGKGRPSKFDPRMIEEARKLAAFGATDEDMASFWGVTVKTFYNWQKEQPAFLQALKEGKEQPDAEVERSLFQRAKGYSHPAVKIFQYEGKPIEVPYTEYYPPDATSMIFWLKNRRPDRWRDKSEVEVKDGDLAARLERAYQRRKPKA
jgi:DNA-binding XRE family transcriptional regulator